MSRLRDLLRDVASTSTHRKVRVVDGANLFKRVQEVAMRSGLNTKRAKASEHVDLALARVTEEDGWSLALVDKDVYFRLGSGEVDGEGMLRLRVTSSPDGVSPQNLVSGKKDPNFEKHANLDDLLCVLCCRILRSEGFDVMLVSGDEGLQNLASSGRRYAFSTPAVRVTCLTYTGTSELDVPSQGLFRALKMLEGNRGGRLFRESVTSLVSKVWMRILATSGEHEVPYGFKALRNAAGRPWRDAPEAPKPYRPPSRASPSPAWSSSESMSDTSSASGHFVGFSDSDMLRYLQTHHALHNAFYNQTLAYMNAQNRIQEPGHHLDASHVPGTWHYGR
jgi:hypothetical protein